MVLLRTTALGLVLSLGLFISANAATAEDQPHVPTLTRALARAYGAEFIRQLEEKETRTPAQRADAFRAFLTQKEFDTSTFSKVAVQKAFMGMKTPEALSSGLPGLFELVGINLIDSTTPVRSTTSHASSADALHTVGSPRTTARHVRQPSEGQQVSALTASLLATSLDDPDDHVARGGFSTTSSVEGSRHDLSRDDFVGSESEVAALALQLQQREEELQSAKAAQRSLKAEANKRHREALAQKESEFQSQLEAERAERLKQAQALEVIQAQLARLDAEEKADREKRVKEEQVQAQLLAALQREQEQVARVKQLEAEKLQLLQQGASSASLKSSGSSATPEDGADEGGENGVRSPSGSSRGSRRSFSQRVKEKGFVRATLHLSSPKKKGNGDSQEDSSNA